MYCMYWSLDQDSMSKLLGGGVPTSDSGYTRIRLRVTTHILKAQRWSMHTNEKRQYKQSVNYTQYEYNIRIQTKYWHAGHKVAGLGNTLPPLLQEGRVLPVHNTWIIDHYLLARSTTTCGPNMPFSPFWISLAFLKVHVWTEEQIIYLYWNIKSNT